MQKSTNAISWKKVSLIGGTKMRKRRRDQLQVCVPPTQENLKTLLRLPKRRIFKKGIPWCSSIGNLKAQRCAPPLQVEILRKDFGLWSADPAPAWLSAWLVLPWAWWASLHNCISQFLFVYTYRYKTSPSLSPDIMVSFMCQLDWVVSPLIQWNSHLEISVEIFCRCG